MAKEKSAGEKSGAAPRNRTMTVDAAEAEILSGSVLFESSESDLDNIIDAVICGDAFTLLPFLGERRFDLLFADPPYNLQKNFGENRFYRRSEKEYARWLEKWLSECAPLLKPDASVYICGDWRSGAAIASVGGKYFKLRNRITWEREKGRGALQNWKNAAEDIWYFTVSDDFTFNLESVKQRRRVLAPYTENGKPKDWQKTAHGDFRDTHPSNIWTDITVPFWSMPENTEHPTQKPEKLLAKIILASTNPGGLILDPFAGSGTTAVAAKKLGRRYVAIEADENYCLLAAKRLKSAETDRSIQGFADGVFWERNTNNLR